MEILKNDDIPTLYGVLSDKTEEGVMGFLIDLADGSAVIRANLLDENQGKYVLGFPNNYDPDSDEVSFLADVKAMLTKNFPGGYQLEWIGHWRDDPRTVKACGWLDGTKLQRDDFFDYMVPERIIVANVENANKYSYKPNPEIWEGDKSKDFYLGYVGAVRVITGLIQNCKTQKELLERVNKLSMDAMILSFNARKSIIS
jgi:hypothetical protein